MATVAATVPGRRSPAALTGRLPEYHETVGPAGTKILERLAAGARSCGVAPVSLGQALIRPSLRLATGSPSHGDSESESEFQVQVTEPGDSWAGDHDSMISRVSHRFPARQSVFKLMFPDVRVGFRLRANVNAVPGRRRWPRYSESAEADSPVAQRPPAPHRGPADAVTVVT